MAEMGRWELGGGAIAKVVLRGSDGWWVGRAAVLWQRWRRRIVAGSGVTWQQCCARDGVVG